MKPLCQLCGKKCSSSEALEQHLNSPAHNLKCTVCNRIFKTELARQQHMDVSHPKTPSKAPSKAPSHKCVKCNGSFGSTQALQQHLASPAHDPALNCSNQPFSNRQPLQQNLVSPVYAPVLIYNAYNRPFDGQHTFQHVRHSPAPAPPNNYTNCNRPFDGLQLLQQQTTDSQQHILPDTAVKVECLPKRPKGLEGARVEPQQRLRPEMARTMGTIQEQDDSIRLANQPLQYN